MQNKGFVKLIAVLLTLICLFYMSFSWVASYHENKAEKIAALSGDEAGQNYLDSVQNQKVYMNVWTLKQCREMGLGLGLRGMIFALAAASVVSGFAAAAGLARGKYRKFDMQPFGPFLTGAGIFYVFIVWPFMV